MEEERGLKMIVILLLKLLEVLLFPLSALVKAVDLALAPPYELINGFKTSRCDATITVRDFRLFVRFKRANGIYVYIFSRSFTCRISNFIYLVGNLQNTSI